MFDIAVPATIGVALIVDLGIVFTILYKRATRDEAFVRTGLGDLVGRVGEVVIGPLDQGPPGRVSVADIHGNRHFVWAVAAPASGPLPQGALVLLVDRVGTRFVAVKADDELKPSKPTLTSHV